MPITAFYYNSAQVYFLLLSIYLMYWVDESGKLVVAVLKLEKNYGEDMLIQKWKNCVEGKITSKLQQG